MAKIDMLCPFTHSSCKECGLYRGRHYYLSLCKQYRGYIGKSKENIKSVVHHRSVGFKALKKLMEPWAGARNQADTLPRIRLKVINMENRATRVCELDETKMWDWTTPDMMRIIGGVQITSWDKLADIVCYKAEKGYQEVEIYEAPRFMLLGGG